MPAGWRTFPKTSFSRFTGKALPEQVSDTFPEEGVQHGSVVGEVSRLPSGA
jgi:hypothetical protein